MHEECVCVYYVYLTWDIWIVILFSHTHNDRFKHPRIKLGRITCLKWGGEKVPSLSTENNTDTHSPLDLSIHPFKLLVYAQLLNRTDMMDHSIFWIENCNILIENEMPEITDGEEHNPFGHSGRWTFLIKSDVYLNNATERHFWQRKPLCDSFRLNNCTQISAHTRTIMHFCSVAALAMAHGFSRKWI